MNRFGDCVRGISCPPGMYYYEYDNDCKECIDGRYSTGGVTYCSFCALINICVVNMPL